jgi:hypothetical protein
MLTGPTEERAIVYIRVVSPIIENISASEDN